MATLEKREQTPGRITYRVRWWADGKQRSKSFQSHSDARRWKAVLEGDMVNGSFVDPKHGAVTVKTFVEENLESLLMDLRASTKARVTGVLTNHVVAEFGHLPLTGVTTPYVAAWVSKMMLTLGPATVRKNAHVLSKVMDLAVSYGLLRANPVAPVRLPAEPKNEQRFLNQAQVWELAGAIAPRFRAMVLVSAFGGLRAGEVAALRRKHIVPERNQVIVRETVVDIGNTVTFGPPKTKTSVRTVTLPRSIMAELVAHMDAYTREDIESLVFTGERGVVVRRSWFFRYYWKPAVAKTGLTGLRFHDLRHTFVALWVSLGRNPKEVSRAAGHSSVAFTLDRYGHLYDTDSDTLADELDGFLGLTRPHDQVGGPVEPPRAPTTMTRAVRPPSSSGPGPRPFTAESTVTDSPDTCRSARSDEDPDPSSRSH